MTRTAVVLGIAALGRPEAVPDCACAMDIAGSSTISKVIITFIKLSFQFGIVHFYIEDFRPLFAQKNYSSAKVLMKNFFASLNLTSRVC
jgi:hypothetical protein